jgi:hypothetical protein
MAEWRHQAALQTEQESVMSSIIVVTARRTSSTSTTVFVNPNTTLQPTYAGGTVDGDGDDGLGVNVNVAVVDGANEAKAEEAAQNIANAIIAIIEAGANLPPSTPIVFPDGKTMTVSELIDLIEGTTFVVKDSVPFSNNGVGGADHVSTTDTLYFAAFVEGVQTNTYTAPGYQGQGVVGIILHEMAHISQYGYDNLSAEITKYNHEVNFHHVPDDGFYNSEYSSDNESYAHQSAMAAAEALGIPHDIYNQYNAPSEPWVGASQVYIEHLNENGWDK